MFTLLAEVTYQAGYSLKVSASGRTLMEVYSWLDVHIKLTNEPIETVFSMVTFKPAESGKEGTDNGQPVT